MKKNSLFPIWGILYILCAVLGLVRTADGAVGVLLTLLALAFFVPPAMILLEARKQEDTRTRLLIRNLSAASLALTALLLVLNILSAFGSPGLGSFLHIVLALVSAPMLCSGFWVLSLFLWACLLIAAWKK